MNHHDATHTPKPSAPDWEAIEADYRAGIKTLRQIAEGRGVSHVTVGNRAKKEGWSRDISEKIKNKSDELLNKTLLNKPLNKERVVAERQLIEVNAQAVADIRLAHRKDIHRARRLTNSLLGELEGQTDPETLAALQELGELMRREDEKGQDKLNDLYHKVISLSWRSKTMKTLAESLQKLVDMERTAFGMDKLPDGDGQCGVGGQQTQSRLLVQFVSPPQHIGQEHGA